MQRQSFLQKRLTLRRLKQEFGPLAGEEITVQDAENMGYSAAWYAEVLGGEAAGSGSVSVGRLGPALRNPDVVDLVRYKATVLDLKRRFADMLETRFSPYDVVAAGVAQCGFLHVCRMLFPGEEEVTLGGLLPHLRRPAVAEFLGSAGVAAVKARLAQIEEAAQARRQRIEEASFALDREVDLQDAEMSGAANAEIHDLAAVWFGQDITLNVETLLMVPQVEAFAKLARWRMMMASA